MGLKSFTASTKPISFEMKILGILLKMKTEAFAPSQCSENILPLGMNIPVELRISLKSKLLPARSISGSENNYNRKNR